MTARDIFHRFCLMIWKNYKLLVGSPGQLAFILLCPPAFVFIAVIIRIYNPMQIRSDKMYDAIDLGRSWMEMVDKVQKARQVADSHKITQNPFTPNLVIGWAPQKYNVFRETMEQAQEQFYPMTLKSFEDCDELRQKMVKDSLFAGVCFDSRKFEVNYPFIDSVLQHGTDIETDLNYTIIMPSELRQIDGNFIHANWFTMFKDDPRACILCRLNQPYSGGFVGYVREGFIVIQKAVSETFLKIISGKTLPEIVLRRFPVLGYKEETLVVKEDNGLAVLILIGYFFPSQLFVWQIVKEKQSQMRLFLINMNIGNPIQFLSWYITCLICFTISLLIIVVLLKVPWNLQDAVLTQTPWYLLLAVLFTYNTAAVSFVCMVASFFTNALTAVRVMTVLWVATYMPNVVLWNNLERDVVSLRYISYLLSNVVLSMVFETLINRETVMYSSSEELNYDFSYRPGTMSVFTSCWIFLVNSLIFCAIGIYMEIWRLGDRSAKRADKEDGKSNNLPDDQFHDWTESVNNQVRSIDINSTKIYEVEPSNRRFKLKIKKLCKRFGTKDRPALNLFTWNVYENEVTVLMGHNGCGKSTLLKILAGLVEPTRGSVTVSNYNIQTERKAASMELGIALGDQLLMKGLTLHDHLRFICRVKGMAHISSIDANINYFMQALEIDHLKNKRLGKLMPRDLALVNICCAFVGNSRIILIDDIHSDLDNQTKDLIWALINEEKSHRTIIIVVNTTALAESIADRMAIMSNGELKCTGTKPFLKNMYGHGFRLICMKGENCNIPELNALMNKHMPNLSIESNIGFKVNYVLENKDEDQFPMLIDELEENMERLDVISFRIRDTSMEEIFLRFGCDEDDQMGGTLGWQDNPNVLIDKYFTTLAAADNNKQKSGCKLFLLHLRAVAYKRWTLGFKHWMVVLLELLTFLIAALCAFSAAFIYGKNYELIPLTYNLSQLENVQAFVELFSDEEDLKDMTAYYSELLYWYDAHVTVLSRMHNDKYALMLHTDFTRNVNLRYTFGTTFDKDIVTAWFNNVPLHIAPFVLNIVHNAVARHFFNEEAIIDVTLETLPFQSHINIMPPGNEVFGGSVAITGSFLLCVIFPALSLFLIRERVSCMKKQQFLAGARLCSYWAVTVLYDYFFTLIYSLCVLVLVCIYHHSDHDPVLYVLLLITLQMCGTVVMLLTYLVSSLCRSPVYGFMLICLINCLGLIAFEEVHNNHGDELPMFLYIFHQYLVATIITKLFMFYEFNLMCGDPVVEFTSTKIFKCKSVPNCCLKETYLSGSGIILDLFILLLWNILFGILLFLTEFYKITGFAACRAASKDTDQSTPDQEPTLTDSQIKQVSDDPSVVVESERTSDLSPEERNQKAVVAVGLVTQHGKVKVLKNLNFALAKGECMNIAGANNSGKSTLMKLMVCETKLRSGQIWMQGYSVHRNRVRCYSMVGYCPQYDQLPFEFTPRQMLYIQALFHGLRNRDARNVTEALLRMLGLYHCCDRSVNICTSGEERRLFYALAVLSSPELVCVDGVPAGLDPIAKRIIFTVTTIMQSMGTSFLYTSLTGMDAERMCVRTPVLFDGQLWMVGSTDKSNGIYKVGYQLEVRFKRKINPNVSMSRSTWNRINHFPLSPHKKFTAFMEIKFPNAVLRQEDDISMMFEMDVDSTTFSTIFLILRKDAFEMNIEDYFITRNMRISHTAER